MKKKLFYKQMNLNAQALLEKAISFTNNGFDGLILFDQYTSDVEHDQNIGCLKEISRNTDAPLLVYGGIRRLEDVKKYLYAGARYAILDFRRESNRSLLEEASKRFGKDKVGVLISDSDLYIEKQELIDSFASIMLFSTDTMKLESISSLHCNIPVIFIQESESLEDYLSVLKSDISVGAAGNLFENPDFQMHTFKATCKLENIPVCMLTTSYSWNTLKLNSDGMIPVIVQDYRTNEVLMLAYMNQEAYEHTLETGIMTYWSRSRNELWVKGDTSGHYQYVRSLTLDCDQDTLLAKVHQIGNACHTGSYSCFFQEVASKEGVSSYNPMKVFEDVYQVIMDRKIHPKEGSYTNYLFEKGIDKILKKVGEEATEIIIAAKNPDPEEIKYEISDFLYHVMVLMAERGVTWEDITRELAQR